MLTAGCPLLPGAASYVGAPTVAGGGGGNVAAGIFSAMLVEKLLPDKFKGIWEWLTGGTTKAAPTARLVWPAVAYVDSFYSEIDRCEGAGMTIAGRKSRRVGRWER